MRGKRTQVSKKQGTHAQIMFWRGDGFKKRQDFLTGEILLICTRNSMRAMSQSIRLPRRPCTARPSSARECEEFPLPARGLWAVVQAKRASKEA